MFFSIKTSGVDIKTPSTAAGVSKSAGRLLTASGSGGVAGSAAAAASGELVFDAVVPLELPISAKYLLLAAFLASYNPAQEDKRIFTPAANVCT